MKIFYQGLYQKKILLSLALQGFYSFEVHPYIIHIKEANHSYLYLV